MGKPLQVEKNRVLRDLLYVGAANDVVLGENAEAVLVEQHSKIATLEVGKVGEIRTKILLGENARLTYVKILDRVEKPLRTQVEVVQTRGSFFRSQVFDLGEGSGQHDVRSLLSGEGAECHLDGLFILDGNQRSSHTTTIDHATPHTTSAEYYKGILSGKAEGSFEGKIIVRPHAQKTSSQQMNRNLLLSKEAYVHTQPLLEIFANDVKCQHGATIGRLDEQALFYLRARGIPQTEAARMLTRAFAEEIVARSPQFHEALRDELHDLIAHRLSELN